MKTLQRQCENSTTIIKNNSTTVNNEDVFIKRCELNNILRYIRPRNLSYYQIAFVHKSFLKTSLNPIVSNERLEYLGDSILNMLIGEFLFDKFPTRNEGFLTKIRIKIVNGKNLAYLAKRLGLEKHVLLACNTKINDNILEDTLEALIGAIYLDYREIDMGLFYCRIFIISLLNSEINFDELLYDTNYKDILLRYIQSKGTSVPEYDIVETLGKVHDPTFVMSLTVNIENNEINITSTGKTKREAEQTCAKLTLERIGFDTSKILIT